MRELYEEFGISASVAEAADAIENEIKPLFAEIEKKERICQAKVLRAFRTHKVSLAHFAETTGYGYDDLGRDTLDAIFADTFGTEAAVVRPQFVSGTHTLTVMLFAVLRPGDTLLSITGAPYDTLLDVISGTSGSLREFGIGYKEVPLKDGKPDESAIEKALCDTSVKAVFMTRSKGYAWRDSLDIEKLEALTNLVRAKRPDVLVLVDNCYGEFVETKEPSFADLFAGSLIKNPGGGLAPCGGYIAGKKEYVSLAADRLTAPGLGLECGANLGVIKDLYMGFFMAPHVVAEAVKCALFASALMQKFSYPVCPLPTDKRTDIIQAIQLGCGEKIIAFCGGLQSMSPVDSFVTPMPWDMPGYQEQIIMAAGAFTQGASIEISADGPIKSPYNVYLQGGVTYESGKLAIMAAASKAQMG